MRSKRSVADESGGEEILYPRQQHQHAMDLFKQPMPPLPLQFSYSGSSNQEIPPEDSLSQLAAAAEAIASLDSPTSAGSPPSSFVSPIQRPRKRTSEEFEMDSSGALVSKHLPSSSPQGKEKDKAGVRRHRSLGVGIPSASALVSTAATREKTKDRRRDTLSVNVRHARQTSASSSSSSHGESLHSRRVHSTAHVHGSDFSHLPPSPSSSSIQQYLRKDSGNNSTATSPLHGTPRDALGAGAAQGQTQGQVLATHVAHSLLRGTQEGWSDLDDHATMEALRKLDGLSGRSARARSSVGLGGHSRVGSVSRPGTPAKTGQWEGGAVESLERRGSKRTSTHSAIVSGRERERATGAGAKSTGASASASAGASGGAGVGLGLGLGLGLGTGLGEVSVSVSGELNDAHPHPHGQAQGHSSEEASTHHRGSPALDKPLKKSGSITRSALTSPKRGSASSGTYTSTPTTSSRDSATLSIGTSATSVSAASASLSTPGSASGRHSAGVVISAKARRNSAGSDLSSSGDAASARDRMAALSVSGDAPEDNFVPPVPPLPKNLAEFKSPQHTVSSGGAVSSSESQSDSHERSKRETISGYGVNGDTSTGFTLEVPSFANVYTPSKHASLQPQKPITPTTSMASVNKTPSKKWSISALGKKLGQSPSTSSLKDNATKSPGFPISPRSLTFGQSSRKSLSKDRDQPLSPSSKMSEEGWSSVNKDAMASASSLASLSSTSSQAPISPPASLAPTIMTSRTPDRTVPSRSGTASSASTNVPPIPQHGALSPAASIKRGPSTKRLTPSSIPFFRRSSSQSMQFPTQSQMPPPLSPTLPSAAMMPKYTPTPTSASPTKDPMSLSSPSVTSSSHKKSSVLSLGLPSLLKGSSSRRSLHSDSQKSDAKSGKDTDKEKDRQKREDKDRSESRISVLMGRKRGKVCVESKHLIPCACSRIRGCGH